MNLYIVATPIGNLEDITIRALETLKRVDLILCEDTRVTKKLLSRYDIENSLLSYHQHSKLKKVERILKELKQGKNLALVSDSGTPAVSDPGADLVNFLTKKLPELKINPIPGPSAVIAALSISGFSSAKFIFLGFPPVKKKRKKFFQEVVAAKYPVIFYESPHRIMRSLDELESALLENKNFNAEIIVAREMTKKFETVYRGAIEKVIEDLENDEARGEFVVLLQNTN